MRAILWSSVLSVLAALPSCVGTAVGNPPSAEVKLAVVGANNLPGEGAEANAELDVGGGIQIEEAWMVLREIGLRSAATCAVDGEDEDVPGPLVVELVTGSIYPDAPTWQKPPDEHYCALDMKLHPLKDAMANAPEELLGHTIYIRGTRGDGTPFSLQGDFTQKLKTSGKSGLDFTLGQGFISLILAFDLRTWLDHEQLDAAEVADGMIQIDVEHNKEIEKTLRSRIPASSLLFRDKNHDSKLNGGDDEL